MRFERSKFYHIYNTGNNQQPIFFSQENYRFFLSKMKYFIHPYADILAYCLMPNHFHILVYISSTRTTASSGQTGIPILARKIGNLLSSYTQAVNKRENRTGSLFQQRTKAKTFRIPQSGICRTCFHHIHQNPLKAGLVDAMEKWNHSSYLEYLNKTAGICNQHLANQLLAIDFSNFKEESQKVIHNDIM